MLPEGRTWLDNGHDLLVRRTPLIHIQYYRVGQHSCSIFDEIFKQQRYLYSIENITLFFNRLSDSIYMFGMSDTVIVDIITSELKTINTRNAGDQNNQNGGLDCHISPSPKQKQLIALASQPFHTCLSQIEAVGPYIVLC